MEKHWIRNLSEYIDFEYMTLSERKWIQKSSYHPFFSQRKKSLERKKVLFKHLLRCSGSKPSLCFTQTNQKEKKKSTEIIRKKKNTQSSSSPLHQTQGKRRQVSICSISTYCNMTKYRSAPGKMTSRQIAQQMVQPISEETF